VQPLKTDSVVFVAGRIRSPSHLVCVAHFLPALNDNVYIAVVALYQDGAWNRIAKFPWRAVDVAFDPLHSDRLWVLGRDGQIGVVNGSVATEARLESDRPLGPMTGLNAAGEMLFAYGMKRDMYRLSSGATWQRFEAGMAFNLSTGEDADTLVKKRLKDVGGINAVVGYGADEVYAVGLRGEIWRGNRAEWTKVDSPTNVMLTDAAVSGSDVVVCGLGGTLLRGRAAAWSVVEYEGIHGLDFSSVACRNDEVYVADGHSLRCLTDGSLDVVDLGVKAIVPSSYLDARDGQVLSLAGQEVFLSDRRGVWRSVL
jgi:hypothetical protein